MSQEGLEDQKEFNEKIGVQRAITRWKTGETTPGMKSFLAIRKAFGRSLEWIIFGIGAAHVSTAEAAPVHYEARPLPPLNEDILIQVLGSVDEYLILTKTKLLTFQKARLICKLYEHCQETKERPTSHLVEIYLRISL